MKRRDGRRAARGRGVILAGTPPEGRFLWISVALLVAAGLVLVLDASYFHAQERFGDPYLFARRQLAAAILGTAALVLASRISLETYRSLAYPLLGLSVVLLLLVFHPSLGISGGGATRWIGWGGIHFQPSELAKIAVVLYLAHSLAKKGEGVRHFATGYLPHVVVVGALAVLVALEPDYGTAVLLGGVLFSMLVAGGARWSHLAVSSALLLPIVAAGAVSADYRWQRITSFLDPWSDAQASGFQLVQSLLAFGSGGFFGVGLGAGEQKMFYLPGAHTDFVFAVVGEELGLAGTLGIVALFALIAGAGLRIAWSHTDRFAANLALGLTALLVLQTAINMGVAVGLLPTKGIALPFLSYGGSALVVNLAMVGMLLAASREAR